MQLFELCQFFTSDDQRQLDSSHPMGQRLVTPEYSKSVKDVKSYPLMASQPIFFLCWNFSTNSTLKATMYPSPERFSYSFPFASGLKTQRHTHNYIELGYVAKGSFRQRISEKDILFEEGDFCLIDKNCIHQDYLLDQDTIVIFLGIENEVFDEMVNAQVTTSKIASFLQTALMEQKDLQQFIHFRPLEQNKETPSDVEDNQQDKNNPRSQMESCLTQLLTELYRNEIGSAQICNGLLLRIFHLLSTEYEFSLTKEQQGTMNWIVFEEICQYIQKHYRTITTQELIEQFHFQKDYFNRLIKKKTSMTYSEYLQNIRLQQAKRLLVDSDHSVSQIAEMVGYHNKGYFYKIFTEKYGMTPARYRKNIQSGNKIAL